MHELPVVQEILKTSFGFAKKNKAKKILEVKLTIGDLTSIVDESVEFYFTQITKNTIAENAKLKIKRTHAFAYCQSCKSNLAVKIPFSKKCSSCGSNDISINSGREFLIDSILIE